MLSDQLGLPIDPRLIHYQPDAGAALDRCCVQIACIPTLRGRPMPTHGRSHSCTTTTAAATISPLRRRGRICAPLHHVWRITPPLAAGGQSPGLGFLWNREAWHKRTRLVVVIVKRGHWSSELRPDPAKAAKLLPDPAGGLVAAEIRGRSPARCRRTARPATCGGRLSKYAAPC